MTPRQSVKYAMAVLAALRIGAAAAQSVAPTVEARIEPDSIMIGDRFTITIDVDQDIVQVVGFPVFDPAGIGDGELELVADHPADTLEREGRRLRLRKRYELTSFEEGRYALGRLGVIWLDKNVSDTLYSADSLLLTVATFQIDTASMTVHDIKPPLDAPFRLGEVSGYIAWSLAALALVALLVFFLVRALRRRGVRNPFRARPADPAHVAAIRALEQVHHQKLWQNGRHKLYYTRITDILRAYIGARYGIRTMEMTSDEILAALEGIDIPPKSASELLGILRTADLVKFAKLVPGAEENESIYLGAYYFVEETKEVEEIEAESDETKRPISD